MNCKYAPYVVEFSNLVLHVCAVDFVEHMANRPREGAQSFDAVPSGIKPVQRIQMENFIVQHESLIIDSMTTGNHTCRLPFPLPLQLPTVSHSKRLCFCN